MKRKRPVFIILEGPDKVGKSYMADKIVKQTGAYYHHEGPPPKGKNLFRHYVETIEKLGKIFLRGRSVVADRLYFGELIYGPILRGKSLLSSWDIRRLELLLMKYAAHQFFVMAPWATMKERYKIQDPPDKLLNPKTGGLKLLRKIAIRYFKLRSQSCLYYHITDSNTAMDDLMKRSYWFTTNKSYKTLQRLNRFGGVGSCWPRLIIVGDQRNKKVSKSLPLPFFANSGSSRWLFEAIEDALKTKEDYGPYGWSRIYVTNSLKDNGSAISYREFEILNSLTLDKGSRIRILALGDNALKRMIDIRHKLPKNMSIESMPHPQYWKRFRAKDRQYYVEKLREHCYRWN